MSAAEVIALLKERIHAESGSQKVFAFKIKVTEPYLSDILLGKRPLGPKILDVLGLEAVTTTVYRERE